MYTYNGIASWLWHAKLWRSRELPSSLVPAISVFESYNSILKLRKHLLCFLNICALGLDIFILWPVYYNLSNYLLTSEHIPCNPSSRQSFLNSKVHLHHLGFSLKWRFPFSRSGRPWDSAFLTGSGAVLAAAGPPITLEVAKLGCR